VLVAAAAVADPHWRETFDAGAATYADARATGGDELIDLVTGFGRFGWLNLLGLVAAQPSGAGLDSLLAAVDELDPADLHLWAIGADRRQLRALLSEHLLRRAVGGEPEAIAALEVALTSADLVIEVTPWLLRSPSHDVRTAMLSALRLWRQRVLPVEIETTLAATLRSSAADAEARLTAAPGRAYLDSAIGGLHYDPAGLDRVVSVSSTQVAPVVVVVDGSRETVIVHPPLGDALPRPSETLLREVGRALGDKTRMQILTLLQGGDRTAVELAHDLAAPRTTLLHHLAILRAAGLVHVTVTPGGATVYRLRPDGFAELARAAGDFVPTR
jgi:DNA-binding transcriptional ArsR family regulator